VTPEETPESLPPDLHTVTIAPPVIAPAAAEINFRNATAVRVGLVAAGISSMLMTLTPPVLSVFGPLILLIGAGFLAVLLYRRRTGQGLSTRDGMRMGWITGMFSFVISMMFFTITVLTLSSRGGLAAFFHDQFAAQGANDKQVQEVLRILEDPSGLATFVILCLFVVFIFTTSLPAIGGALGAKVLEKD
jgi:hypothetical protein